MADLEERIGQWRREMAESLGGSAEWLEELEGHLRDEITRLVQAGRPAEQAFAAAVARVGDAPALADEFARVTPATPWLPIRVAVIASLVLAGLLVGFLCAAGRADKTLGLLLATHITATMLGTSLTLLIGTLAACYVLVRPFGRPDPRQVQGLIRATRRMTVAALVLTVLGVVLGGFWAQQHWGRFWGWDIRETCSALVILWDAVVLAVLMKRLLGPHGTLLLGLAGNAVVALSWFGPALFGTDRHAYGYPQPVMPVVWFVSAQAALACLGLVPAGYLGKRKAARAFGEH